MVTVLLLLKNRWHYNANFIHEILINILVIFQAAEHIHLQLHNIPMKNSKFKKTHNSLTLRVYGKERKKSARRMFCWNVNEPVKMLIINEIELCVVYGGRSYFSHATIYI